MSKISPILPEGEDAVISIRGLRNAFGEQVIHENLDFDVKRGEIIGVVGGSGTGKSVLMRSIIGLQTPDQGTIEVLGEDMVGRPGLRRVAGLCPLESGGRACSPRCSTSPCGG